MTLSRVRVHLSPLFPVALTLLLTTTNAIAQPAEPRELAGHLGAVLMGQFTPDSSGAVTVSTDQTARLWDVITGKELRTYSQHTGPLFSLGISGDGRTLVTGSQDNSMRVWDVPLRLPIRSVIDAGGGVKGFVLTADGGTLLSVTADQKVRLYSLAAEGATAIGTPAVPASPPLVRAGHVADLLSTSWRPDGGLFASSDIQGRILLWSPFLESPQGELTAATTAVSNITFTSNNQQLISAGMDGRVRVWQLIPTAPELIATAASEVVDISVLPNQPVTFWANADGTSRLTQFAQKSIVIEFPKVPFQPTAIVQAPNNTWVGIGGETGRVVLFNVNDGVERGSIAGHDGKVLDVAVHADSARFATAGADGSVRLWEQPQAIKELKGHSAALRGLAIASNGSFLASISDDMTTRIWDANGGQSRSMANHEQPLRQLTLRDDDGLLATGDAAGVVWVWNPANGTPEGYLAAHPGEVTALMFSSDRNSLVTAGREGVLRRWTFPLPKQKPAEGEEPPMPAWEFAVPNNEPIVSLAPLSAEQGFAALGGKGTQIFRFQWDGSLLPAIASPGRPLKTLSVTVDGSKLLAVDDQGGAHLWDINGKLLKSIPLGPGVISCRWHREGTEFVVTDGSRVRLVSAETGHVLEELVAAQPILEGGYFGQDWRTIAVIGTGNDGMLLPRSLQRAWELQPLNADGSQAVVSTETAGAGVARNPVVPVAATAVWFTPDQQHLLAGGVDGWIRQWNLGNGELVRAINSHQPVPAEATATKLTPAASATAPMTPVAPAASVDISLREILVAPNGQLLVALGNDETLRTFQLGDGSPVRVISLPSRGRSVTVSPDSTRGAIACEDGRLCLFDLNSGELLQSFARHAGAATAARYLSDGQTLVSGGVDKTLQTMKSSILKSLPVHQGEIRQLVLYNGGSHSLTTGDDGQIVMFDLNNNSVSRLFRVQLPMETAVSEPGVAGTATAENPASQTPPVPRYQDLQPTVLALRPDNQRVAAGTETGDVYYWNINAGDEPMLRWSHEGSIVAIAFSPDNQKLAIATSMKQVSIYGPSLPGVSPQVELSLHQQFDVPAGVTGLQFATDSRTLWASTDAGTIDQWMYAAPGATRQFNHGGPVYGVAISRDGKTAISCSNDQSVRVFDVPTGQQKYQLNGHTGAVHAIAMSPDETFAVSSGADGTLRLWDIVGGRQLKQLIQFDETMYSVTIHPKGQLVAAAGADRKIHLLDMITGAVQRTLEGHTDYIHSVTFNPDGTHLMSYGYAGHLKIWNTADGKLLHESRIGKVGNDARYSPDGKQVILSNGDGHSHIIPTP